MIRFGPTRKSSLAVRFLKQELEKGLAFSPIRVGPTERQRAGLRIAATTGGAKQGKASADFPQISMEFWISVFFCDLCIVGPTERSSIEAPRRRSGRGIAGSSTVSGGGREGKGKGSAATSGELLPPVGCLQPTSKQLQPTSKQPTKPQTKLEKPQI